MRNYRTKVGTESRLDYGLELVEGLKLFPETAPLATDFEQLHTELEQAHEARRGLRKPLVKARVKLRLANFTTDQVIRACAKAAELADGGRRGPIFDIVFPSGLSPVIAPMGARQIKPTEQLRDRLDKAKHPGVVTFAQEWKPKIEAALTQLTTAAATHLAARKAHDSAFQTEVALRDEHRRSIDRLMGLVRAAFPGDRTRQDLVFPAMADEGPAGSTEAEAPTESEAPDGGAEPTDS